MGAWSFIKRQARHAASWTADHAGELARGGTTAIAGAAGTVVCGPACGAVAAVVTDAAVGGKVERVARRGVEKPAELLEDHPGTPSLPTELSGHLRESYELTGVEGGINELRGSPERSYTGAIVAGGAGLAAVAVAALLVKRAK